ncbi:GntR family transcriptional regulator [Paenibacillus sp. 598K]|uniref:GntR family transcriptional regulator n=1 Tax=Paenibacillus sp. 598K TaxID=1117987 RepID=UPI000FFAF345|nr:GntR family transcriptional regulator [Paenibacillus sp. 598K]GBF74445.1 GntR family transcriptional regulator [Paenibacillus sp. 598K]
MSYSFDDSKPIFLQIKERIENQIVSEQLKAHEQIPSTTQLVSFYKINHLTVAKGINLLADEGIIYKKRGVGMFVAEDARERLLSQRKDQFVEMYVRPMITEAHNLGITPEELSRILEQTKGSVSS